MGGSKRKYRKEKIRKDIRRLQVEMELMRRELDSDSEDSSESESERESERKKVRSKGSNGYHGTRMKKVKTCDDKMKKKWCPSDSSSGSEREDYESMKLRCLNLEKQVESLRRPSGCEGTKGGREIRGTQR